MNENELIDNGDGKNEAETVNDTAQIIGTCIAAGAAVVLFNTIFASSGFLWKLGSSIAAIFAGHYAKRKVKTKSLSIPKSIIAFSLIAGYVSLGLFLIAIIFAGVSMLGLH